MRTKTTDEYELEIVKLRQHIISLDGSVSRKRYVNLKRLLQEKEEANLQLLRRVLFVSQERDKYKDMVEKLVLRPVDNFESRTLQEI